MQPVPLFQGKGESPPSGPCNSPTVPRGCYEALSGRALGTETELRTASIGPFPKLHLFSPTTSPTQSPLCSQPLPRTAVGHGCADRGCRTSVESTRLCHSWGASLGAGGHSVPSPAQLWGQGPASPCPHNLGCLVPITQMPEQCHVGRIPAKALIRHRHSQSLVTQRREEIFRLLCPPPGFLAPLNLHNSPSAVPWGQWDPRSSQAPCGSCGFLRSAPALALAHANNCTNGSLPARGGW